MRVRDSKTAAGIRPVYLTKILQKYPDSVEGILGTPFVFPSPRIPGRRPFDYKKGWQKAARELEKHAFVTDAPMNFRASFASRANACHASGLTIAQLLGHAISTQILPTHVKPLDENTKAVIVALDNARVGQSARSSSIQ
jgi:integrase